MQGNEKLLEPPISNWMRSPTASVAHETWHGLPARGVGTPTRPPQAESQERSDPVSSPAKALRSCDSAAIPADAAEYRSHGLEARGTRRRGILSPMRVRKADFLLWILSGLLAVLMIAWISGYLVRYDIGYRWRTDSGYRTEALAVFDGDLCYDSIYSASPDWLLKTGFSFEYARNANPMFVFVGTHSGFFVFTTRAEQSADGSERTQVGVPFWFLSLMCIAVILWRWSVIRRRRLRLEAHLCIKCGYDLRAISDRCPECGTAIPTSPAVGPAT